MDRQGRESRLELCVVVAVIQMMFVIEMFVKGLCVSALYVIIPVN